MLPETIAPEALAQQGALLAASLAAQTHRVSEFRARLREHTNGQLKDVALRALALGWSEKWRAN
jgi:hypothetical protein